MRKQFILLIAVFLLSIFFVYPVSALTLDSVEVRIYDNDSGKIDIQYSLNIFERIYYEALASLSGGEKKLIESKSSDVFGTGVKVEDFNAKSNEVVLSVPDIIHERFDYIDGYWITYKGITDCPFTIKDVRIIFPDGFVKVYYGEIPSGMHFVNEKLATYYYQTQYFETVYNESYGLYDKNTYSTYIVAKSAVVELLDIMEFNKFVIKFVAGEFLVSGLPSDLQARAELVSTCETITTGKPYTSMRGLVRIFDEIIAKRPILVGHMGQLFNTTGKDIAPNMKKMSELKAEEAVLIEKLLSETDEWNENLNLLIANLESQETTLCDLEEETNGVVDDVKFYKDEGFYTTWGFSDNGVRYLESISGLAKQIVKEDIKIVKEELEYLKFYF